MANNMIPAGDAAAWVKDGGHWLPLFVYDQLVCAEHIEAPAVRTAERGSTPSNDRDAVIRECVTWLAMNHADWKPEALAGEMARALLSDQD